MKKPLKCDIFEVSLNDEQIDYEALSYTWKEYDEDEMKVEEVKLKQPEKAKEEYSVECNQSNIPIGSNLSSALFRLRRVQEARILWIDQICINQADKPEKGRQIPLMADIYSKAFRVLIWLGEAKQDSELAMDAFPVLVRKLQEKDSTASVPYASVSDVLGETAKHLGAMKHLLRRRWFDRVWTLQEAAAARECLVICGDRLVDFNYFLILNQRCQVDVHGHWKDTVMSIARSVAPKSPNERYVTAHIVTIDKLRHVGMHQALGSEESLFMLLNSIRTCGAEERKDRVYAMYKFLPKAITQAIGEQTYDDYTAETLFAKVAVTEIFQRNQLAFITAAGITRQKLLLPSWVPDWTYAEKQHSFTVLNHDCVNKGQGILFQASKQSSGAATRLSECRTVLYVAAKPLGTIVQLGQPFEFPVPNAPTIPTYQEEWNKAVQFEAQRRRQVDNCITLARSLEPYHTGPDTLAACRRTLVGGMKALGGGDTAGGVLVPVSDPELAENFDALDHLQSFIAAGPQSAVSMEDIQRRMVEFQKSNMTWNQYMDHLKREMQKNIEQIRKKAMGTLESIQDACKGRVFFVMEQSGTTQQDGETQTTQRGRYMGLAPQDSKHGDLVCVILGCPVPLLFRPVEEGDNSSRASTIGTQHYRLLGECYVDGFMKGKVMDMVDIERRELALI